MRLIRCDYCTAEIGEHERYLRVEIESPLRRFGEQRELHYCGEKCAGKSMLDIPIEASEGAEETS